MKAKLLLSSFCGHPCYRQGLLASPSLHASNRVVCPSRAFSLSSSPSTVGAVQVMDNLDCLPNPRTPWLKLYPEIDTSNSGGGSVLDCFYSPVENQVVRLNRQRCLGVPDTAMCFTSAREWLAFVDPTDDCPVYLANPFRSSSSSSSNVIRLPSLATMPNVWDVERDPTTGKILQFKVQYDFEGANEYDMEPSTMCYHSDVAGPISGLMFSAEDPTFEGEDCVVVALYGWLRRLVYSPLSKKKSTSSSSGWIALQDQYKPSIVGNPLVYSDFKKLFFTLDAEYGIQAYDLDRDLKRRSKMVFDYPGHDLEYQLKEFEEEEESQVLKEIRKETPTKMKHLVSLDNGDLLLIIRHMLYGDLEEEYQRVGSDGLTETREVFRYRTLHFDVFRINFCMTRLERLTTLGERSIFVGDNQSFSVWTPRFPGLKTNSIYFTSDSSHSCNDEDSGIFNLEDNTIHPLSCPYAPVHLHPNVALALQSSKHRGGWTERFWVAPPKLWQ